MKKVVTFVLLFFMFSVVVSAACTHPHHWPQINISLRFCGNNFFVKEGLKISNDHLFVDCGSAVLQGFLWQKNVGILIEDRNNVTLVDCRLVNYGIGALIRNSTNIVLKEITLLRNMVGLHIINSLNVSIVDSFDISLQRPVRVSNSSNVTFQYNNKNIKWKFSRSGTR